MSTRGWAFGYLGGGLLLALNLGLFLNADGLGLTEGEAVRICFLSVASGGPAFTLIPLRRLRDRPPRPTASRPARRAGGFRQLAATLRALRAYPLTLFFLVAYLIYNDGIQTVIALAAQYGDRELELSQTVLISTILLVQFLAFGGALLLGRIAGRIGAKRTVLVSLVVWIVVLCLAFFLQRGSAVPFYVLGAAIGLVLGGSQALTRSLFSQLTPRGKEAEYFGLYEISDKGTSWLGPLTFGLVFQLTDSYRVAIISLVIFFVVGGLLLAGWTCAGRSPTPAASGRRCCERVGSAVGAGRGRPPQPAAGGHAVVLLRADGLRQVHAGPADGPQPRPAGPARAAADPHDRSARPAGHHPARAVPAGDRGHRRPRPVVAGPVPVGAPATGSTT